MRTDEDGGSEFWARSPDGLPLEHLDELRALVEESLGQEIPGPSIEPRCRYEIERELAHGGMGQVLEARDVNLGRTVAMKTILQAKGEPQPGESRGSGRRARRLRRFLREARITGRLNHPGVIPVHELGLTEGGEPYYTMPLVRGRTLGEVFRLSRAGSEGWSVARALGVLLRVCETLAFAHGRGVVHRDLKPDNVIVGAFGETYVLDWGLAKVVDEDDGGELDPKRYPEADYPDAGVTAEGAVLGTAAFMSPEQASGRTAEVGPRSDVYALGASLYTLLSGRAPYQETGTVHLREDLLAAVVAGPPRPIDELAPDQPAELRAICARTMARRVGDRYGSMDELAADLRAFLEVRVVQAHQTGTLVQLRKWFARNRAMAGSLMAGLLVALALLVTVIAVQARSSRRLRAKNVELQRLADLTTLTDLAEQADALWPVTRDLEDELVTWVADARAILGRLPLHRRDLERLQSRGGPAVDGARSKLTDRQEQQQHDTLVALTGGLEELAAPVRRAETNGRLLGYGLLANVEWRLELSRRPEPVDAYLDTWERAVAEIADPSICPRYEGLRIRPQPGLVPLGRDPHSNLWEFGHPLTGALPERRADGTLAVTMETGLVLVLLPGGTFWRGAQSTNRQGAGYDPAAAADEQPVREVRLDPFLLSKYEMTQGQWERLMWEGPSGFHRVAPEDQSAHEHWYGPMPDDHHPVETVSWEACAEAVRRMGLELPTEAQWEYAARGGTETPWWTGGHPSGLEGAANLLDATIAKYAPRTNTPLPAEVESWLTDGYVIHAPVGSFDPNPFGLYDVYGNVAEWCRDLYEDYGREVNPGDGLQSLDPENYHQNRVVRGGSYSSPAVLVRSACRTRHRTNHTRSSIGLRPSSRLR